MAKSLPARLAAATGSHAALNGARAWVFATAL